jgi:hypothetical protein
MDKVFPFLHGVSDHVTRAAQALGRFAVPHGQYQLGEVDDRLAGFKIRLFI